MNQALKSQTPLHTIILFTKPAASFARQNAKQNIFHDDRKLGNNFHFPRHKQFMNELYMGEESED